MTAGRPLAKMRRVSRSRNKFPWNCAPLKYKSSPITSSSSTIPAMGSSHNLKKSLHPKKEVKTRFFLPISKPKDGVNAEERHTFLSMQVPSSCCTFFQHSVLFSLWSIHCSGLFCFFSSYVGSGLAMAISKDINEQ